MKNDTETILEQMAQHQRTNRPGDTTGHPETEQEEESHFSAAYAAKRGQKDKSEDIEFRLLDPNKPDVAAEYSFRRRTIWHKKHGSIELVFVDGLKVTIEGVNLWEMKEKIRARRVTWVQEQGTDQMEMEAARQSAEIESTPFVWVERITIEEPEE